MGLLTGEYQQSSRPGNDDIRSAPPAWLRWFNGGEAAPEWLAKVDAVRDVLTSDGRSPAQGAIAWQWARSPRTIPIPGFRSVVQAEANASALRHGPLRPEQMAEIERILAPH
jgi:aryl-alcohol dehydrogenase-like predicted oxidoreductase